MKDKELYDFFKDRKHAFDEAPDAALWAKIEGGLTDASTSEKPTSGLALLKKLLIIPLLGAVVAIIVIVAYSPKAAEETPAPQNTVTLPEKKIERESEAAKIIETIPEAYTVADSVKKKKKPLADAIPAIAPNPETPPPANPAAVITPDINGFDPDAVKAETRTAPGRVNIIVKQPLTKSQLDRFTAKIIKENSNAPGTAITIKAAGHKPFRHVVQLQQQALDADNLKPQGKDTLLRAGKGVLMRELVEMKPVDRRPVSDALRLSGRDSVKLKPSAPEVEIISFSQARPASGTANELLVTPGDSLKHGLRVIQSETRTEPGRITITVKQSLTKKEFENYTQKVLNEGTYGAGVIITINAPGHKPFIYKMPKTEDISPD